MEIAGAGLGQYDQLLITGSANLGGYLDLVFLGGFAPDSGDVFDLMVVSSILSGSFQGINIFGLQPGFLYSTSLSGGAFQLTALNDGTAVPEPWTGGLIVVGLGSMLLYRRRAA